MSIKVLGEECGQSLEELRLWETMEFDRIIEIGTWKGGFSLYLYLLCLNKGKEFHTFDIYDYEESFVKQIDEKIKVFLKGKVMVLVGQEPFDTRKRQLQQELKEELHFSQLDKAIGVLRELLEKEDKKSQDKSKK